MSILVVMHHLNCIVLERKLCKLVVGAIIVLGQVLIAILMIAILMIAILMIAIVIFLIGLVLLNVTHVITHAMIHAIKLVMKDACLLIGHH